MSSQAKCKVNGIVVHNLITVQLFSLHFILYTLVLIHNQKGGFYGSSIINRGGDTNSNTVNGS